MNNYNNPFVNSKTYIEKDPELIINKEYINKEQKDKIENGVYKNEKVDINDNENFNIKRKINKLHIIYKDKVTKK